MENNDALAAADAGLFHFYKVNTHCAWNTLTDRQRQKLVSKAKTLISLGHLILQKLEPRSNVDQLKASG